MSNTKNTEWLREAVKDAQAAARPNQPITIEITLNDNSVHNYDNRMIVLQPQRRRVVSQCHPSRNQLTGYVYNPNSPLDRQQLANEAIAGFY